VDIEHDSICSFVNNSVDLLIDVLYMKIKP
jgi:hypothetical protein